MGGRLPLMVILSVVLLAAVILVVQPDRLPIDFHAIAGEQPEEPDICASATQLVPQNWLVEWTLVENTDGDSESECIVVYRYDRALGGFGGPLGVLIYDPQPDRSPGGLATQQPYRPASFIPYLLMPRQGGQGYFGEQAGNSVSWSEMVRVYDVEGDGQDEVVLRGYSGYTQFPTTVSIFEWTGPEQGYRLMTSPSRDILWGDAGIDIIREQVEQPDGTTTQGQIQHVFVRKRLFNPYYYARSQICYEAFHTWDSTGETLHKVDRISGLAFCFGRPIDPDSPDNEPYPPGRTSYQVWHPEEAVLASYPDRRVVGMMLTGSGERDRVEVIAHVKDTNGGVRNEDWLLRRTSSGNVGEMFTWELTRLGDP